MLTIEEIEEDKKRLERLRSAMVHQQGIMQKIGIHIDAISEILAPMAAEVALYQQQINIKVSRRIAIVNPEVSV